MRLDTQILARHVYVLGGTGVGKSRAMETWIMQLIQSNQCGVGIIDPHGELFYNILARIAKLKDRRLWRRVIVFNPLDASYSVGFNPLELQPGEVAQRKAQFLTDVMAKIWRVDTLIAARMMRIMVSTFWLLAETGLTLREAPRVLTEPKLREHLLTNLSLEHPLRQYWEHEFPTNPNTVTEWTQSTLNKVGNLVIDPDLELVFGQQQSTIDFRRIMDDGFILLVNLSKGQLVSETSHMLGAFVMAQIQQAAFARAAEPHVSHRQFVLFLDEFQSYTTDNIHMILAEGRKYGLSLIMAHQFYEQLRHSPELQAAVITTVGNLVCFRLGYADAQVFVRDVFQPQIEQVKDVRVHYQHVPTIFGELPQRFEDAVYRGLDEIWEAEARKLTTLANRQFWYKKRGPYPPHLFGSLSLPDVMPTASLEQALDELIAISNASWAVPKAQVRHELAERHRLLSEGGGEPEFAMPAWGYEYRENM